jgi:hypothetical protein
MVGPVRGYKFISEHKNIESIIKHIINDAKLRKKHDVPDDFNFLRAR